MNFSPLCRFFLNKFNTSSRRQGISLCYHFRMPWLTGSIVACVLVLAAAAQAQETACRDPYKPMLRVELFFGRNIGGRHSVSERQWAQFLKREITPRFTVGLTVIEAQGQWRSCERGTLVREPSKIVVIVTDDDASARACTRRQPALTSSASIRSRSASSRARSARRSSALLRAPITRVL